MAAGVLVADRPQALTPDATRRTRGTANSPCRTAPGVPATLAGFHAGNPGARATFNDDDIQSPMPARQRPRCEPSTSSAARPGCATTLFDRCGYAFEREFLPLAIKDQPNA